MPKIWNIYRLRPISGVESLALSVSGLEHCSEKMRHSSCVVLSLHVDVTCLKFSYHKCIFGAQINPCFCSVWDIHP